MLLGGAPGWVPPLIVRLSFARVFYKTARDVTVFVIVSLLSEEEAIGEDMRCSPLLDDHEGKDNWA